MAVGEAVRWLLEPMREEDLARVLELERLSSRSPWSARVFRHELGLAFSRLLVARRGPAEPVVGYACWWEVAGEVHVLNVVVHPEHRRIGIGAALVRHILVAGANGGATVAGLEVGADNLAARELYERHGFHAVGQRRDYYGPGRHAVLMDCVLAGDAADERGAGVA